MANVGEGAALAQRAGGETCAAYHDRHVFAGVLGAFPTGVAAVVGGEQQQVVVIEGGEQLRQAGIEVLQRGGVARYVPAMAVDRIEIHEVGHDHGRAVAGLVGGARDFRQGGIHQGIVAAGFDLVGNAAVGVDVGDLANRHHFTTGVGKLLQHGGAGRLNAVVAAIAGAGKAFTVVADKRAGDYTANVVGLQQFTHGFTQRVEAL